MAFLKSQTLLKCSNLQGMAQVIMPSLERCEDDAFLHAFGVKSFSAPNLCYAGAGFLLNNVRMERFYAPKLTNLPPEWQTSGNFHFYYHPNCEQLRLEQGNLKKFLLVKKKTLLSRVKEFIRS